jgi:ubiquitin carboxyl-terminal hydrolase 47
LTFGDHVGGARTYYSFELFLEIRGEREEFRPYNKGGLNLKVLIIDLPEATVREPIQLRAEQTWKVQDLKAELAKVSGGREKEKERGGEVNSLTNISCFSLSQRYDLSESTMNLALETYNNDGKHLTNPNILLKNEGFYRRHTVCQFRHLM